MEKPILLICITLLVQNISAQTCKVTIPASTPDNRFIVNGDEVVDKETGLIWQHCSLGQTGGDCSEGRGDYSWQDALQAAENERASTGKPWRLPNIKELRSIVEERCYYPSINLTIFPGTISFNYWSSSPNAYILNDAWSVHFVDGISEHINKLGEWHHHLRLVRDGSD